MGIVEAFAVRCKMVDKSGQVEWHDRLRALGVRRKDLGARCRGRRLCWFNEGTEASCYILRSMRMGSELYVFRTAKIHKYI